MTVTYNDATFTYDASGLSYDGIAPQFDGVTTTVQAAFGYAPLNPSPHWQDITEWVRDLHISRGRRSQFVSYGVGQAKIRLDNRDRRFDPEYTSSPYYGDLNPMVPIRVQVDYSGSTYTLFYGFVQGWPTAYSIPNVDAVSTIQCVDASRLLGNIELPISLYRQTVLEDSPSYYWDFQSPSNNPQYDVQQNLPLEFTTAVAATPQTFTSNLPLELQKMASSGGHYRQAAPISENVRVIEFWTDAGRIAESGAVPGAVLVYRSTTDQFLVDVDNSKDLFEIRFTNPTINRYVRVFPSSLGDTSFTLNQSNHIVVQLENDNNMTVYINGQLDSTYATSAGTSSYFSYTNLGVNVTSSAMSNVALYTQPMSAARIAAHFNAGQTAFTGESSSTRLTRALDDANWPTTYREIETGVQQVGAYQPDLTPTITYLNEIESAEQGAIFVNREGKVEMQSRTTTQTVNIVGLFDDENIDLPFSGLTVDSHTVDAIRNNIVVSYATDKLVVSDATSISAYGQATQRVNAYLIDDPNDAQSIGETLLAQSKDPQTIIKTLSLNMRSDIAAMLPVVAPFDLYDNIAVRFTPTGVGDPLWRAVTVQGVRHTITGDSWETELYLAPSAINTNGALLVLDDDTYGKLDDGNKLG